MYRDWQTKSKESRDNSICKEGYGNLFFRMRFIVYFQKRKLIAAAKRRNQEKRSHFATPPKGLTLVGRILTLVRLLAFSNLALNRCIPCRKLHQCWIQLLSYKGCSWRKIMALIRVTSNFNISVCISLPLIYPYIWFYVHFFLGLLRTSFLVSKRLRNCKDCKSVKSVIFMKTRTISNDNVMYLIYTHLLFANGTYNFNFLLYCIYCS